MTSEAIKLEVRIVDEMNGPENLKGCSIHLHAVARNHKIW
jgi:hypothetical protein